MAAAGALVLLGATGALSGCSDGMAEIAGQSTSPGASTTAAPAALVLADAGIGGLHLGQSKEQALATGLVGKLAGPTSDDSEGCAAYHGKRGIDRIYFHAGKVMIISVTGSILTDKGIGIDAGYRVALSSDHGDPDDTILELALQANTQPCYQ